MEIYDEARLLSDPNYLPRIPLLTASSVSSRAATAAAISQLPQLPGDAVLELSVQDSQVWRLADGSGIRLVSNAEPLPIDDNVYQAQARHLFGVDWIVTESGQLGPLV